MLILLFLLIALLLVGVPVAFTMLIVGSFGLFLELGVARSLSLLGNAPYYTVNDFTLTAIPLFILMAEYMKHSGLAEKIFEALNRWIGDVPGGLAIATAVASGFMGVLSGSSSASAAAMSSIAVPEMRKYGYSDQLSLGAVCAAGTFAILFPPSLALILYGILTQTSIAHLFLAGIIPGILTLVCYVLVILIWARVNPDIAPRDVTEKYSWPQKFESLLPVWPAFIIVLVVLGGIYMGVVTPSEAGAVGALATFGLGMFHGLNLEKTNEAVRETLRSTTMIFFIIFCAVLFGRFLSITGVTADIVNYIEALPIGPTGVIIVLLILYVLLGTMMDQLAVLILSLPLTYPLATGLGLDSVWFGIFVIKTVEIGLITPPFGLNVYIATSMIDVDAEVGFRGAIRFLPADLLVLALLIAFPELVTWLPEYIFA